jgi:hypothetical protein
MLSHIPDHHNYRRVIFHSSGPLLQLITMLLVQFHQIRSMVRALLRLRPQRHDELVHHLRHGRHRCRDELETRAGFLVRARVERDHEPEVVDIRGVFVEIQRDDGGTDEEAVEARGPETKVPLERQPAAGLWVCGTGSFLPSCSTVCGAASPLLLTGRKKVNQRGFENESCSDSLWHSLLFAGVSKTDQRGD